MAPVADEVAFPCTSCGRMLRVAAWNLRDHGERHIEFCSRKCNVRYIAKKAEEQRSRSAKITDA